MFRAISDYFRRRRYDRQRQLYRYFDGERTRSIDPLEAHIALELHETFNWEDGELLIEGDPVVTRTVINAVCDVFHVQQWDDKTCRGITGAECLEILDDYMAYCETVKKNTDIGPISPQPTESESSPSPADPVSATNGCSVSG